MDANGLVVMPGKGPVWKMAPGRSSTLKLRNGETDESVMIFEEVAPVGTVTPMHLHHDSDEVAYVLRGEITFKIGDAVTVGGPGTCAFMPRDVPHAWKSTGAEIGRVLFLYTPGSAGKLFEEMAERPVDPMEQQSSAGCRTARLGDRRPAAPSEAHEGRRPRRSKFRIRRSRSVRTCG